MRILDELHQSPEAVDTDLYATLGTNGNAVSPFKDIIQIIRRRNV